MAMCPVDTFAVSNTKSPNYKVAFYASPDYHMQDENGKRSGYGYDMMQTISNHMQCTFSYVGYDKTPKECEEMLRNGELDLYTAAKRTPEREEEFAISTHPAITATTCMNVKVGNETIIAGDYSTYNGIKVGLQSGHTYNREFLEFAKEKDFHCQINYYDTPTELSNALISGEIDALVSSYIRISEDERQIETFGETPYYIMARKEDKNLIDQIDDAIDRINKENPNWRTELYDQYYGHYEIDLELTEEEQELLTQLVDEKQVIRGVMDPDAIPYSWYEDGEAYGIVSELFKETARQLGLKYEIVPVETKEEYQQVYESGQADIWMDIDTYYANDGEWRYKITEPYLTTTASILRRRDSSHKIEKIVIEEEGVVIKEIITATWPEAEIYVADSLEECTAEVLSGAVDGVLLKSYTAQRIAGDDIQNRLRAEIVSGVNLELRMGVLADRDYRFYGLWQKSLIKAAENVGAEAIQTYVEITEAPTILEYLFDQPIYLITVLVFIFITIIIILMYLQSVKRHKEQEKIASELAKALEAAESANKVKQEFFSKMSHDIRTPLNVVLGMTQIAQKYKHDIPKLENALEGIASEGNYLLVLVNSILDINQLEYGYVELLQEPFDLVSCVEKSVQVLQPLAENKKQQVTVDCGFENKIVIGDANRYSQIIINILSNAIKYTDVNGKINIRIEYLPENICRFICKDNGIGMTKDYIEHICEAYSRAEDSRVSKIQGTGLGMSVVKGFIDLMKGTLRIESELGKGSTFIVDIPFQEAAEEHKKHCLCRDQEKVQMQLEVKGKKVLLVEDNELNAEIAMELLKGIGFDVVLAENGKIGVDKYLDSKEEEYYAIFMDVQMPVMDGIEATKIIRESKRKDRNILIFAMTANMFSDDKKKYKEVGMDGFIAKPISTNSIIKVLKEGKK